VLVSASAGSKNRGELLKCMKEKKNKILVAEDELACRNAFSAILRSEGFLVIEAKDGQEGFNLALKEKPDLILLDILMPVMDGLTMLQKLRQSGEYGEAVPVILLTNLSADKEDIIEKVAETGPVFYMVKVEFTLQQVVERIKEVLAQK